MSIGERAAELTPIRSLVSRKVAVLRYEQPPEQQGHPNIQLYEC